MVMGVALGALLAVAGLSRFRVLRWANQVYIAFFRGTPILVQLMLVYFGIPYLLGGYDLFPPAIPVLGFKVQGAIVAGILAFGLHEAAYMSEITRAGILSIDPGQTEAAKSLGMVPSLTMRRIILPDSIHAATYRTFEVYLGVSVYYLLLTAIWTLIQQRIEHRLASGYVSAPRRTPRQTVKTLAAEEIS
jgi:polar amino acid transport system permease protein